MLTMFSLRIHLSTISAVLLSVRCMNISTNRTIHLMMERLVPIDVCLHGNPRNIGNTTFYFFNRKSELLNETFQNTLRRCEEPENKLDDQKLLWEELILWKINKSRPKGTFHHCDHSEHLYPSTVDLKKQKKQRRRKVSQHAAFNYCCLDPYYYPTGKHDPSEGPINQDPITYHANWVLSYKMEVHKLIFSRWDHHGWNESRFLGKHGGLLGKRGNYKFIKWFQELVTVGRSNQLFILVKTNHSTVSSLFCIQCSNFLIVKFSLI